MEIELKSKSSTRLPFNLFLETGIGDQSSHFRTQCSIVLTDVLKERTGLRPKIRNAGALLGLFVLFLFLSNLLFLISHLIQAESKIKRKTRG